MRRDRVVFFLLVRPLVSFHFLLLFFFFVNLIVVVVSFVIPRGPAGGRGRVAIDGLGDGDGDDRRGALALARVLVHVPEHIPLHEEPRGRRPRVRGLARATILRGR